MAAAPSHPPPDATVRQDLVFSRQEQQGVVYFVVKDPVTRRFFRFKEPEAFIIRRLDGSHSADAIRTAFEDQFGATLSALALAAFTSRLGRLGLLSDRTLTLVGTARTNWLYLRFPAFDPDRFLTWLLPRTRGFFTRRFFGLSLGLISLAAGLTAVHTDDIGREAPILLWGSSLLMIWLTVLAIGVTHECAHGLACKRYGGEVREMGFMLLFFTPAFYCNVSDAWLFPKRQRFVVLFAGVYWQLVVWALATVTWRVTPVDTTPHLLALIVMATSGIYTFFNLNPLIKLDGYYLLSDYLELPNLRPRAFAYLRSRVAKMRGAASLPASDVPARERRIYLSYGLVAGGYSVTLLTLIAARFGGFMTDRFQGAGFIVFMGVIMTVFRKSLAKLLRRATAFVIRPTGSPARTATGQSRLKKSLRFAVLASVALFLVMARLELRVAGEFRVEPSHNADIRPAVEGIIGEIPVREGERVEPGQVIAKLMDRDLQLELRTVQADLANKRATLRMLRAGPRRQEIDLARQAVQAAERARQHALGRYQEAGRMRAERAARAEANLDKTREQLEFATTVLARHRGLFDRQLLSRVELDEATQARHVKQRELQEAQALVDEIAADDLAEMRGLVSAAEEAVAQSEGRLEVLLAGTRPEQIEALSAEIDQLLAHEAFLDEQLALTTLTSPIAGVVTTPDLEEKLGQHVSRGDLVAEVYELTSVIAELSIPERDIADVSVGDPVVLKARAYFAEEFAGQVVSIAPAMTQTVAGSFPSLAKTIRVTTRIDNPGLRLKPGMTGMAKISCGRRHVVDLITRRIARYLRVEFWSYW